MTIHLIKFEARYYYKFYCGKELTWSTDAHQLPKHIYTDPDTLIKFTQHEYRTDCEQCLGLFKFESLFEEDL
jgi:hypothetical protein